MIDPFERGKVWFIYSKLEREFIETTSYVALETGHKDVWSEKYGELLIKIGSAVGSFFDFMVNSKSLDNEQTVENLRAKMLKEKEKREQKQKKGKKKIEWSPTMTDFRKAFNPVFDLKSAEVEASYGLTYYGNLQPFEGFGKRAPFWWDSYNKVKHQFFEKIEERARLEHAINALAALFILNILHKENQEYLIKYQNVITCDYAKQFGKKTLLGFFEASKIGVPKTVRGYNCMAVTPLFKHVFRIDDTTCSKYTISADSD
jgi:hypothetical protein